jgi:SAM-dependent methyltransferase
VTAGSAGQAARPHGLVGRGFGRVMAFLNDEMNRFALARLDVRPDQRVLEVGFGPGLLVRAIADGMTSGSVDGVDWSPAMIAQARARNRGHLASGRVRLHEASITRLPFPDASFDRACAVNSFQFWPDPRASLRELRRVLRPGARVAIALRTGAGRARFGLGGIAEPERVGCAAALLPESGFGEAWVETERLRFVTAACVLGVAR